MILTSAISAYAIPSVVGKAKEFIKTFLVLSILLGTFAYLNEHLIKPAVGIGRPSHTFILKQSNSRATLDSLYTLAEIERREFFHQLIISDTIHFKTIDQRILDHWVVEDGYSFPSGHSFNAFLLAGILAFKLLQAKEKTIRFLGWVPLTWAAFVALSRVAIGAHSALDVTVGAGIGLALSIILIAIPATRKLLQSGI